MLEASTDRVADLPAETNATDHVLAVAAARPHSPAYAVRNGAGGWVDVSYAAFLEQVRAVAKGLIARGVEPGSMVGIMAPTSYEWAVIDQAIWFAGAASVPVYETSSPHQVQHILTDSGTRLVFTAADRQADAVRRAAALAGVEVGIEFLDAAGLAALAEAGRGVTDAALEAARSSATLADLASLVYTSGTTGRPKGTRITHGNFAVGAVNLLPFAEQIVGGGEQRTLMFLPLAHVLAHAVQYVCLVGGIQIAHASDLKTLTADLASFHPTWLLAVPRVFEKLDAGAAAKAREGGTEKVFAAARRTAVEYSEALDSQARGEGNGPGALLRARHALFDRLVYPRIRAILGGAAKYTVSGASALNPELAHFFRGAGLGMQEGYGLTETTAPATLNIPGHTRVGSVGLPVPGTTIRIADDREILIKGPIVFDGYHRLPEETAAAFDADGFFRSGDIGRLDEDGFLYVTGRKKEIIVTAGGKNVYPTPLEEAIRSSGVVSQVVVVGDGRPYVGALVTLDPDGLSQWATAQGLPAPTLQEACTDPRVRDEVQKVVDAANEQVSRAESVRRFLILDTELTEESGHLTPSLKLQRKVVMDDYAAAIEDLYRAD
ncbi:MULTISPECIES: long-chain fatty acid--CoA ligase [Micrococcaceae]|uniref:AMP-dependent synthetase/ligase n=1 Tax=Micrococcaceae TaxID=1268 RepID=UPI00161485FC|nr:MULTISPECIES: AMP-dependent synthetase/ligase [Micrococcaceae]MBB5748085.1 long-chain acyl-CoA synthetase [Micrococcus sp. TA1]HRO30899.1 AMP-dependent synthetase/ligase [Citricoccus sp.]HRO92584.1 AMP-dependent synthetase/ligase [Citricoccus sp.]